MRGHATHVVRRRGSRAIRRSNARIVLRTAPREANTRVTDGVTLHLIDRHLGGMAMDELDKAATLAGGDLDVGDVAEALEERAKLILGDIAGKATDEHSRVVGVGELVHGLHRVESSALAIVGGSGTPHGTRLARMARNGRHHLIGSMSVAAVLMGAAIG